MRNRRKNSILLSILLTLCFALPALCGSPFAAPSVFQNKVDGTIVFAADWNNVIGGIYSYINSTLLPQFNVLQNKGDIYAYTGSALIQLPVGSNGQVLTANSAASGGINWTAGAGLPITTKGDLVVGNSGGAAARLGVGTNGQVLTADSTQTNGAAWEAVASLNAPSGAIIMFNLTYGGSIPAGWVLCDGTNSTPNMIGMIPIGAQASGGSSSPNAAGFGNVTYGTQGGAITVSPAFSVSANTGGPSAVSGVFSPNTGTGFNFASNAHIHSVIVAGSCTPVAIQPATYGLVFIQKT